MSNPHFVCAACGGVSETAKNCTTEGCVLEGKTLATCNCEDGMHAEAKQG